MKIIIASKNKNKVEQIKEYLKDLNINFLSLYDFPEIPEIAEDGKTFEENALKKSKAVYSYTNLPSLSDDSGLEIDSLNGEPGIFSARYAGNNASDEDNNKKLLRELENSENRKARYRCVLSLYEQEEKNNFFEGSCNGEIVKEPKGKKGFGYDPLFLPEGFDKTFGELDLVIKLKISHRGKALNKLKNYLLSISR